MTRCSTSAAQAIQAAPGFLQILEYVVGRTGLAYYAKEVDAFAGQLAQRMAVVGVADCAPYSDLLQTSAAELDELVSQITIGETYFFRHTEAFEALRTVVLPELLERNQQQRTLRIWSAGCANGPEVYSLAILLGREFGRRLEGWSVSIVGTDINRRSLAQAQQGRFGAWALRSVAQDVVDACFTRSGCLWEIRPEHRRWTRFQFGNLAEDPKPGSEDPTAQDLVLCRNVMIYFDRGATDRTLRRLRSSMADGGWLLIGPAEHTGEHVDGLHAVSCPGVTLYRRRESGDTYSPAAVVPAPLVHTDPVPASAELWTPVAAFDPPTRPPVSTSTPLAAEPAAGDPARVRVLADRGAYASALEESECILRDVPGDVGAHFYRALVLAHLGRSAECEQALRRVLYLDRNHALAHYELAGRLLARGDRAGARRSLRNVLNLLEGREPSKAVCGEAVTVGELASLASGQLRFTEVMST